ncbi:GntR family transcriptional regulator, partial [Streptosporangium sp. NPDC023825]|uniref:GntR family transcriptional regulator n=1 Tax=Streptosporangium sp. NPDC023825 TaxID=3154909 RepID=UPI00341E88C4
MLIRASAGRALGEGAGSVIDTPRAEGAYRPGYEVAAEQVLESISRLRLRPGDRMPTENELARQLGTSRTVVRE